MSKTRPKEMQSAFERWEMAAFEEEGQEETEVEVDAPAAPEKSEEEIAAEVASIREQARLEGFAQGLSEGRKVAQDEGREKTTKAVQHLMSVSQEFSKELQQANEIMAQEILDLSLDFSKAMLKSAIQIRPELVLPIVSEAIHYLPTVQQPANLYLHRDDLAIVREYINDDLENWRISEDPLIERGGCRVETASNQIDASLSTRWYRLNSSLNKNTDWLA